MPTIRLPDPDQPPPGLEKIYATIRRREDSLFGHPHISNIWLCQAHAPEYLRASWERSRAIRQRGQLPTRTQELTATAVSAINRCHY